jgi:hypothetical protein
MGWDFIERLSFLTHMDYFLLQHLYNFLQDQARFHIMLHHEHYHFGQKGYSILTRII